MLIARVINFAICTGAVLGGKIANAQSYAYGSTTFRGFVQDSFQEVRGDSSQFYRAFEDAFQKVSGKKLTVYLDQAGKAIRSAKSTESKVAREVQLGRDLHRVIKKSIPRFSLDRGFEFYQTTRLGERQCFLQSVLIAGMLQRASVDAGVVMVYRNERGDPSNNGHAVTLVRLADQRLLVVDASEPHAFATHQGLFVRWGSNSYRFMKPDYIRGLDPSFSSLRLEGTGRNVPSSDAQLLDVPFLRSQFDYYRGERAPDGFLSKRTSPTGLATSKRYLARAVQHSSQNPLAVYILGRVEEKLGQTSLAAKHYRDAIALYNKFGWMPGGVKESLARVSNLKPSGKSSSGSR